MTEFVNNVFDLFTLRPMDSGFRRNDGMSFKMSTLPSQVAQIVIELANDPPVTANCVSPI